MYTQSYLAGFELWRGDILDTELCGRTVTTQYYCTHIGFRFRKNAWILRWTVEPENSAVALQVQGVTMAKHLRQAPAEETQIHSAFAGSPNSRSRCGASIRLTVATAFDSPGFDSPGLPLDTTPRDVRSVTSKPL